MENLFPLSEFWTRFATDAVCLEEIKKIRYPKGIYCIVCKKITKHYQLRTRLAYSCKFCRNQIYPLAGTLFAKTTTPLRLWFYVLFLMTQTRGTISAKQVQRELEVTYKTAWRMRTRIYKLMAQNNSDLLTDSEAKNKVRKWTFFNKFQITVVEKQEPG